MKDRDVERLNYIFHALANGKIDSDVDRLVEEKMRGSKDEYFGRATERQVAELLRWYPGVLNVAITIPGSLEDHQGKDLRLKLKENDSTRVNEVFVQVKSSYSAVEEYKSKLRDKYRLNQQQLQERMFQERLILVAGRQPQEEIVRNFEEQLNDIQDYHRHHPDILSQ